MSTNATRTTTPTPGYIAGGRAVHRLIPTGRKLAQSGNPEYRAACGAGRNHSPYPAQDAATPITCRRCNHDAPAPKMPKPPTASKPAPVKAGAVVGYADELELIADVLADLARAKTAADVERHAKRLEARAARVILQARAALDA